MLLPLPVSLRFQIRQASYIPITLCTLFSDGVRSVALPRPPELSSRAESTISKTGFGPDSGYQSRSASPVPHSPVSPSIPGT